MKQHLKLLAAPNMGKFGISKIPDVRFEGFSGALRSTRNLQGKEMCQMMKEKADFH